MTRSPLWRSSVVALALGGALAAPPAWAQQSVSPCTRTTTGGCQAVSAAAPLPVTATVSVGGFAPSLAYATCTATGSACASTALPTNTGSVVLFNSGSTTVSCTLASGAATGTTSKLQIPASSGLALATVYGATTYDHFACIDQSGSASNVVIASGGSGLPTGWGGGGSGGSGGAVTIASGGVASGAYASGAISDGANVTLGSKADAKSAATDTTPITQMQVDKQISFNGQNPNTASAINPTSTLTLPSTTTAYTAGTLICTSATVATCNTALQSQYLTIGNSAGGAKISRMRLTTNDATSTAWGAQTIQIDLWSAFPTFSTTGDRGAFNTDFATGSAGHLGAFICVMSAELADGAYSECYPTIGNYALLKLASGTSIFWTAQAITGSGVTGASKVLTLTAEMAN